jgi:hypothetical protein
MGTSSNYPTPRHMILIFTTRSSLNSSLTFPWTSSNWLRIQSQAHTVKVHSLCSLLPQPKKKSKCLPPQDIRHLEERRYGSAPTTTARDLGLYPGTMLLRPRRLGTACQPYSAISKRVSKLDAKMTRVYRIYGTPTVFFPDSRRHVSISIRYVDVIPVVYGGFERCH